jgi:methyl-accepting chemotaxis protein
MYMRKYDMIIFKYEITRSEVYRRVRQCEKIKEISIEQADSMEQVEATEERIAEVVQNNSDVAQETSATSEELTAQATTLSGMVSVFKLRQ